VIATATVFKLKSWWRYFSFFGYTFRALRQARNAGGIVHIKIRPLRLMTLTVWKSEEDMKRFRNSGAHLVAMRKSNFFGSIYSATWETADIPTWKHASKKLSDIHA